MSIKRTDISMSIDNRRHDGFIFATDAAESRYYVAEFEYDESPEENEYRNPGPESDDFNETLASIPGTFGAWRHDYTSAEMLAFADAAMEGTDLENGANLLKNATASFRPDLSITYLGEANCDQGCLFFGFLFSLADRLQVAAWIEDDLIRCHVVYRGDQAAFEQIALELKMHEGECFRHLRDG